MGLSVLLLTLLLSGHQRWPCLICVCMWFKCWLFILADKQGHWSQSWCNSSCSFSLWNRIPHGSPRWRGRNSNLPIQLYTSLPHSLYVDIVSSSIILLQNLALTDAFQKVTEAFKCTPVEGILSHRLRKNTYDQEKTIILNPSDSQRWSMCSLPSD